MIKSNSKAARRAVEAYVLTEIEDVNDRMEQENTISAAFETLNDEMSYQSTSLNDGREIMGAGLAAEYHKARRYDFVAASTPYWVWCLAAQMGEFDVYYQQMRDHVAEWLQETPEEASRYSDSEVQQRYYHMTASAFERLYNKEAKQS